MLLRGVLPRRYVHSIPLHSPAPPKLKYDCRCVSLRCEVEVLVVVVDDCNCPGSVVPLQASLPSVSCSSARCEHVPRVNQLLCYRAQPPTPLSQTPSSPSIQLSDHRSRSRYSTHPQNWRSHNSSVPMVVIPTDTIITMTIPTSRPRIRLMPV